VLKSLTPSSWFVGTGTVRVFGANDRTEGSADVGEPVVGPDAQVRVGEEPEVVPVLFSRVGRSGGRRTVSLCARVALLSALRANRVGVLDLWDA
jgi:hypothetical protein